MILVSLIFLSLGIWVTLLSWAEVLTIRPQKVLHQLETSDDFSSTLVDKMLSRLKKSTEINPKSANGHFLLAQYYEYLYRKNNNNLNYKQLAENEYITAIGLQPTWEKPWAKLALFYDKQDDINKTQFVLEKAIFLAPFEYNSQDILLPLIFKHWDYLHSSLKNEVQIKRILEHISKFNKKKYLAFKSALYSKNTEIMELVESIITDKKHKEQLRLKRLQLNKINTK